MENLRQAPFNTTMMGAMRGALDYYGSSVSHAMLYGASGHAFAMNIHNQLCPSGPYCFNRRPVYDRLANIGLRVTELGFFWNESPAADRSAVEARLRGALSAGIPCMMDNMEFQLITGMDETGFLTAQPWPGMDFPQAHLTFESWQELGNEIHMSFAILEACEPVSRSAAARAGIQYAVDLWTNPKAYSSEHYGMGPDAYTNWVKAVRAGDGSGHGCWWNGTVWSECRWMAGRFLAEAAEDLPDPDLAGALSEQYGEVAKLLERCADKALPTDDKLRLLDEALEIEGACVAHLELMLEGAVD